MKRTGIERDHIDPLWEEGRDYQLVCGRDVDENILITTISYNCRKQNRFVPYRIHEHSAPTEFGDVGEFLIEGEWKVCEFGGKDWWEESTKIGCGSVFGAIAAHTTSKEKEMGWWNPETREANRVLSIEIMREVGKSGKGAKWWYHPTKGTTKVHECPGEGWSEGRGDELNHWWVNKEGDTRRGSIPPGEGWKHGRKWED